MRRRPLRFFQANPCSSPRFKVSLGDVDVIATARRASFEAAGEDRSVTAHFRSDTVLLGALDRCLFGHRRAPTAW